MNHWQHGPHSAPRMVTEFVVTHGRRTVVDSSYTFVCQRENCAGVPAGLTCRCAAVEPEVQR